MSVKMKPSKIAVKKTKAKSTKKTTSSVKAAKPAKSAKTAKVGKAKVEKNNPVKGKAAKDKANKSALKPKTEASHQAKLKSLSSNRKNTISTKAQSLKVELDAQLARVKSAVNEVVTQAMAEEVAPVKQKAKKKTRITKSQELAEENLNKLIKKWQSLQTKTQNKGIKAEAYNMRKTFEAKTPILHKVLGWGYIMNNVNHRLEVLFKDGVKYLISNYK